MSTPDGVSGSGPLIGSAQRVFYETFGYLKLPGVFTDDVERISRGFDEVFESDGPRLALEPDNRYHHVRDGREDATVRTIIPSFIDQSDDLSWIRTDPRVLDVVEGILGPGARYAESDGNLINCDVRWHTDVYGVEDDAAHLKLFFYLDPLRAETGALRVMPGSHGDGHFAEEVQRTVHLLDQLPDRWGCGFDEVPATVVDVDPGDLVIMDFKTVHASLGGLSGRRLFTVNFAAALD